MTTGVVLMAYGTPGSLEDVPAYLASIRGGREPSPEAVASLRERYRRIGGSSPLLEVTRRQALALARELGEGFAVQVGMKHWYPSIEEAVQGLAGCDRVVGLAAAPHYSSMSVGGYERRLLRAAADAGIPVQMIRFWYHEPAFVDFASSVLRNTLRGFEDARVIFTAHSLPARILEEGDPYRDQLLESAQLVAGGAGASDWELAFQSAGRGGEAWLGPDVVARLEAAAAEGVARVVLHPIGFTADHLEILYDLDICCGHAARRLGLELRRTPSPNDHPAFVAALAAVVRRAVG